MRHQIIESIRFNSIIIQCNKEGNRFEKLYFSSLYYYHKKIIIAFCLSTVATQRIWTIFRKRLFGKLCWSWYSETTIIGNVDSIHPLKIARFWANPEFYSPKGPDHIYGWFIIIFHNGVLLTKLMYLPHWMPQSFHISHMYLRSFCQSDSWVPPSFGFDLIKAHLWWICIIASSMWAGAIHSEKIYSTTEPSAPIRVTQNYQIQFVQMSFSMKRRSDRLPAWEDPIRNLGVMANIHPG